MLIGYNEIVSQYKLDIRGILHIGAHFGEESDSYGSLPVIYFEPIKSSFVNLQCKVTSPNAILVNKALGNENREVTMYVETANKGQSNSILKPKKHLTQYPSITFDHTEVVEMVRLDDYLQDKLKYNFINMDVQGYELEVLKGATKTLENIDYIYSEINRDEVYEGCVQEKELDEFLAKFSFKRVVTDWQGGTWGDALWIKEKVDQTTKKSNIESLMDNVLVIIPDTMQNDKYKKISYNSRSMDREIRGLPKNKKIIMIPPNFSGDLEEFIYLCSQKYVPSRKVLVCNQNDIVDSVDHISVDYVFPDDALIFYSNDFRSIVDLNSSSPYQMIVKYIAKMICGLTILGPHCRKPIPVIEPIYQIKKDKARPFNKKISIILGTLNRCHLMPGLIENTIGRCDNLELVIADGGSTDGTIQYIKGLNNPRIKLIEIGHTSSYPHFMNTALEASSYEWVCQWTDDSYLVQSWEDVIDQLDNDHDFYLFTWKWGTDKGNIDDPEWLKSDGRSSMDCNGWKLFTKESGAQETVLNMGIYRKQIFREIGMYNEEYTFWCADGDMSERAYYFDYKYKILDKVKVLVFNENSRESSTTLDNDMAKYMHLKQQYSRKELPANLKYLKNKLRTTVFIPAIPKHYMHIDEIVSIYMKGTELPDEIVISMSNSSMLALRDINDLQKKFPKLRFILHKRSYEAGPSRQFAKNLDTDIIIYQDCDDLPHVQRVEVIKNIFMSDPDIWVINHSYKPIYEYNEQLTKYNSDNVKIVDSKKLKELYFPNGQLSDAKKFGMYGAHIEFPVHAGVVSIRKNVLDTIKWKSMAEQQLILPPGNFAYGEDAEFCLESLFYLGKSIIIDAPLYFYRR